MHIKTGDVYEDIANDVEKRFDTENYATKSPLPVGKNIKVTGLMKDELGREIQTILVGLRPKTYCYFIYDSIGDKKAKGTKKCVIKRTRKFKDYKNCLKYKENHIKITANVFTEEINKIVLSSNYDYRLVMESHHIHMLLMLGKYTKQNCQSISKYKIISLDNVTNEYKTEHNPKLVIHSRSSIQSIND